MRKEQVMPEMNNFSKVEQTEQVRRSGHAAAEMEMELRRGILEGRWLPNSPLPSETQLSRKYGICRNSVRKVIARLESEGVLRRVRGSGTYLARRESGMAAAPGVRQFLLLSLSSAFSRQTFMSIGTLDTILAGLQNAFGLDCNLMIAHVGLDWKPPACLVHQEVDGVIFHGPMELAFWEKYLKNIPCVGLNHRTPGCDCDYVCVDLEDMQEQAVALLAANGHRRISFLSNECDEPMPQRMCQAFRAAMERHRLPLLEDRLLIWQRERVDGELCSEPLEVTPDYVEHIQRVFQSDTPPTALVCTDTYRAWRAIQVLQGLGLHVPQDVSVLGAFNSQRNYADYITEFNAQLEAISELAAKLLLGRVSGQDTLPHRTILVKTELLQGVTVCPPSEKEQP